ncbi:MAG: hypothetical protein WBB28_17930 [Crinalium sp.]
MTNQIKQIIESSLSVFQEFPQVNNKVIVEKLISQGISRQDAWRIVCFVPLAFNRILMHSSGVAFSNECIIEVQGKTKITKQLKDEPFFQETLSIALSQSSYCQEYWMNLVSRSVELKAINQSLYAGSNLEDLLLSSPILVLPTED